MRKITWEAGKSDLSKANNRRLNKVIRRISLSKLADDCASYVIKTFSGNWFPSESVKTVNPEIGETKQVTLKLFNN